MGTHHSDGGNVPPDGDRSPDDPLDLPEFPPEWGEIIIPDDASELSAEAEQVRRELAERHLRPRPAESAAAAADHPTREPSIGVPLLIMSVAVVITMVSLFAMAWSGSTVGTGLDDAPSELPRVSLTDALGEQVPIAGYPPAAILLVEACDSCETLVSQTVAAAPAGVVVLAVGGAVAPAQPADLGLNSTALRSLADPDGTLRAELGLGPPVNAAAVILVDRDLRITRILPAATSLDQFQSELESLI